jgi:hypothetical protein
MVGVAAGAGRRFRLSCASNESPALSPCATRSAAAGGHPESEEEAA